VELEENKTLTRGDYELWNHFCISDGSGNTLAYVIMKQKQAEIWELWRSVPDSQPREWSGSWDSSRECYEALFQMMRQDLA
jgi:hypothetical protein